MSEKVDNLILEHLRAIRTEITGLRDDVREVKSRITGVEAGIGGLKRDSAGHYSEETTGNR